MTKPKSMAFVVAVGIATLAGAAHSETVALFPLESVNISPNMAKAVELTMTTELEARGYRVIAGAELQQAAATSSAPAPQPIGERPATAETPPAEASLAGDASAVTEGAVEAAKEPAEGTADAKVSGEAAAATSIPAPATPPAAAPLSKPQIAEKLGAGFYIDGAVVQLGHQIVLDLKAHLATGQVIAYRKTSVESEAGLPRAVQTSVVAFAAEMSRYAKPAPQAAKSEGPPATSAAGGDEMRVVHNFGVAVGQLISLVDELHTYTFLNFNGRFEFDRLLLITNAGFAIGNRQAEDGFHFNLNLSLAAYLTRTQISPYLGGGIGLFIGNKLVSCPDEPADEWGMVEDECDENAVVGWDVFPVLGLELLKTRPIRVHVESRYLVAFNAYQTWGHGPMIIIGAAF